MKGGKGGKGRAKRFMKKSSSGAEYGKLNSNVKEQVSARVEKKKTKYSDDITKKTKKTKKLEESIQKNKKKGFWARLKTRITFKQARINSQKKTIKQTQNKLAEVEKLNNAIKTIDKKNEATKKAAETQAKQNEYTQSQKNILSTLKQISDSLNNASKTNGYKLNVNTPKNTYNA